MWTYPLACIICVKLKKKVLAAFFFLLTKKCGYFILVYEVIKWEVRQTTAVTERE